MNVHFLVAFDSTALYENTLLAIIDLHLGRYPRLLSLDSYVLEFTKAAWPMDFPAKSMPSVT